MREAQAAVEQIFQANQDNWTLAKSSKKSKVYYMKCETHGCYIYKGVTEVEGPLEYAIQCIYPQPIGCREKWDKNLRISEVLAHVDEETFIMKSVTHPVAFGLISAREFIDVCKIMRFPEKNYALSCAQSIASSTYPEQNGLVRGWNFPCGTHWEILPGNKVRISYTNHTAIKGSVPTSIVDATLPKVMVGQMDSIQKQMKMM